MRAPPKNPLSAKVITVARLGGVGLTLLVLASAGFFGLTAGFEPTVMAVFSTVAGVSGFVFFVLVRPKLLAARWRYELLDHEVYVQRGIVTLQRTNIPYVRVQNVDTSQGPVARHFGVSSVRIATAGGVFEIPILDDDVAQNLRAHIDARAKAARSENSHAG